MNTDLQKQIRSYARVLVRIGAGLKPGQPLCIEAPVSAEAFVLVLAEEAWKEGASDVVLFWRSPSIERKEMHYRMPQQALTLQCAAEEPAKQGAAYIRLDAPQFYEDEVPADRVRQRAQINAQVRAAFRKYGGGAGQTLACVAGKSWADRVFSDIPEAERMQKLWEAILHCTYCDQPDPEKIWRQYLETTARRKEYLDSRHYQAFHYSSPDTDLTLKAADGDFWKGSCVRKDDRISVPNIPTQEIFISPHKYSAEGHIAVTKPLNYAGEIVEGIHLTFSKGRVVQWSADRNQKILDSIIGTDEGSCYLGEAALVDEFSPIAQTGRLFYETLYDENASCHIALGSTIGPPFDQQEKEQRGYNTSSVHVDMMVGSKNLTIRGQLPDGSWEDLLVNGRLIPLGVDKK